MTIRRPFMEQLMSVSPCAPPAPCGVAAPRRASASSPLSADGILSRKVRVTINAELRSSQLKNPKHSAQEPRQRPGYGLAKEISGSQMRVRPTDLNENLCSSAASFPFFGDF